MAGGRRELTAEPVKVDVRVQAVHLFPGDAPLADDVGDVFTRAHGVGPV